MLQGCSLCDIMGALLSRMDISTALINITEEEDKQEETGCNETGDKGTNERRFIGYLLPIPH